MLVILVLTMIMSMIDEYDYDHDMVVISKSARHPDPGCRSKSKSKSDNSTPGVQHSQRDNLCTTREQNVTDTAPTAASPLARAYLPLPS